MYIKAFIKPFETPQSKLIFTLIQLSEMHGAGRVKTFSYIFFVPLFSFVLTVCHSPHLIIEAKINSSFAWRKSLFTASRKNLRGIFAKNKGVLQRVENSSRKKLRACRWTYFDPCGCELHSNTPSNVDTLKLSTITSSHSREKQKCGFKSLNPLAAGLSTCDYFVDTRNYRAKYNLCKHVINVATVTAPDFL